MGALPSLKTLIIVRHGQAQDASHATVPDYDRVLTRAGQLETLASAVLLRPYLQDKTVIVCSAAVRTLQTAQILAKELSLAAPDAWQSLYHADVADWGQVVTNTDEEIKTLVLVGHNPYLSYFVGSLLLVPVSLPTAGFRVLQTDGKTLWRQPKIWANVVV